MVEVRDLNGSVVVITGASSGMGLATAPAMLAQGSRVVLGVRNTTVIDEFVAIAGANNSVVMLCDIRKPAECEALMAIAIEKFGRIDSIVANAGIGLNGGIMDYSNERLNEMMETNL